MAAIKTEEISKPPVDIVGAQEKQALDMEPKVATGSMESPNLELPGSNSSETTPGQEPQVKTTTGTGMPASSYMQELLRAEGALKAAWGLVATTAIEKEAKLLKVSALQTTLSELRGRSTGPSFDSPASPETPRQTDTAVGHTGLDINSAGSDRRRPAVVEEGQLGSTSSPSNNSGQLGAQDIGQRSVRSPRPGPSPLGLSSRGKSLRGGVADRASTSSPEPSGTADPFPSTWGVGNSKGAPVGSDSPQTPQIATFPSTGLDSPGPSQRRSNLTGGTLPYYSTSKSPQHQGHFRRQQSLPPHGGSHTRGAEVVGPGQKSLGRSPSWTSLVARQLPSQEGQGGQSPKVWSGVRGPKAASLSPESRPYDWHESRSQQDEGLQQLHGHQEARSPVQGPTAGSRASSNVGSPITAPQSTSGVAGLDLQVFNRMVEEMRQESEQVAKLKQQNKLLAGWLNEAQLGAHQKGLQATAVSLRAEYGEQASQRLQNVLHELDIRLTDIKDHLVGTEKLEEENRALQQKVTAMLAAQGPKLLLDNLKAGPKLTMEKLSGAATGRSPGGGTNVAGSNGGLHLPPKGTDLEELNEWVKEMAEEGGQVAKLKRVSMLLQGWYADANTHAADSLTRIDKEERRFREAQEESEMARALISELEVRLDQMHSRLAKRSNLEEINKELHERILAMSSSSSSKESVKKQQDILFEVVTRKRPGGGPASVTGLGFSRGRPVAAYCVWKAVNYWRLVQSEDSGFMDRLTKAIQAASNDARLDNLTYWLSNAAALAYLNAKVSPTADSEASAKAWGTLTEHLYTALRTALQSQLLQLVSSRLQIQKVEEAVTPTKQYIPPLAPEVEAFWTGVTVKLRQLAEALRVNHVPQLLARALLIQLLAFVDGKVLNTFLVGSMRCPCLPTHADSMEAGIGLLDEWLVKIDSWNATSASADPQEARPPLALLRQALGLLVDERKGTWTIKALKDSYPDLSICQLAHLCIWFENDRASDKDRAGGISVPPGLLEQLWCQVSEDDAFLVREDKSLPFSVDVLIDSLEFDTDAMDVPAELAANKFFYFLQPASSVTPSPDAPFANRLQEP